mgnify:CR=1 FL=1
MHYFFTKEDLDVLNREISAVCDHIKDAGKEMGLSCQEGAETFHDNFAYEQGERDQNMWSNRLRQLIRIRNNAKVVAPGPSQGKVSMGRLVTIRDLSSGEGKTFRIGSYMIFDVEKEGSIRTLSYSAPMSKALIGANEGEEREAFFGGKKHRFKVVKVE